MYQLMAQQKTATKRHHYVPQFYLHYFCNEGKLWVYDKEGRPPRIQTPVNTAVEGHLYSLNVPEGMAPDLVETQVLGPIENDAKPVLDRWQYPGERPVVSDVLRVAPFLAFMHTRNPRSIEMVREINHAAISQIQKDLAENPARQRELYERARQSGLQLPPYEEMEEYLNNPEKYFKMEVNKKAALLESIELTQEVCTQLLQMNWCLCTAPAGSFFITCDSSYLNRCKKRKFKK